MDAVGLIFANIHDSLIPQLTSKRTLASVPFGGRYRLVDFALSSMVNSNINKIGIATRQNYQSLMDHISSGKDWDLARRTGGLYMIPPFDTTEAINPNATRLQALVSARDFLTHSVEEYVVISDGDCVYNIDFHEILNHHIEQENDITVVCKSMIFDEKDEHRMSAIEVNADGKVTGLLVNYSKSGYADAALGLYVIKRQLLIDIINNAVSRGYTDFQHDIIGKNIKRLKIGAFRHNGLFFFIDSVRRYFEYSMSLLEKDVRDELFNQPFRAVYTKVKDSAPTKFYENAKASNCFLADGCEIDGTVINSILFRDVKIKKGAVVQNCVIMQGSVVGQNCNLNYCIADKNCVITEKTLIGCKELPYFVAKDSKI